MRINAGDDEPNLLIRRADAADAEDCARLVLESAERFLPAVFGPRIAEALVRLAAGRGTLFSHEHAWIAERRGEIEGALLGYTAQEKAAEDVRTGLSLLWSLGPAMLTRLGRLLRLQGAIGTLQPGEYYISNVAAYPLARGRGAGSALIDRAAYEAAGKGALSLVLDVETDNEMAARLYARLGFTRAGRTDDIVLGGVPFSFFRMVKALGGSPAAAAEELSGGSGGLP